ncbi:class I SAM-dependent methyltransferase [Saccharopolyspora shandongensis]|uniref:class I SAM-dependent methyltransferase n=1 Tax=Saccharopolyspora shandongensis TaxID=418495 RepID=UPI00343F0C96
MAPTASGRGRKHMSITLPELTPTQESLFLTLGISALDSRLPRPFLGDPMADEILKASGYDLRRFALFRSERLDPKTKVFSGAVRAKHEDEVVARFVAAHPDAVVLDLGTGLDTRVFRTDPPPTVDWYDIDFPTVIDLRRQLVPEREGVHLVAADLTEPGWLADIPGDRPTMIVHNGLVPFLSMGDYQSLLLRLTRHFQSGEMAHNSYTRPAVWTFKRVFGDVPGIGFNDPRAPERWVPGLKLVEEIFNVRSPEVAEIATSPAWRLMLGAIASSTILSRHLEAAVLHYRF